MTPLLLQVRQWVLILAQIVGIGGVLYETLWEHADRPALLKLFGLMIGASVLGGGSWLSLLRGLRIRLEVQSPQSEVPTLRLDMGNNHDETANARPSNWIPPTTPSRSTFRPREEQHPLQLPNNDLSEFIEPSSDSSF